MIFGKDKNQGLVLDGFDPKVVSLDDVKEEDLIIHDEKNPNIAAMLCNLERPNFPIPIGIIRSVEAPVYETEVCAQIDAVTEKKKEGTMKDLLNSGDVWEVK